jgi:two-component system LytT family sensor kinase
VLFISTLASFLFGSVSYAILVILETDNNVRPKTLLLWLLVRCYVWAALSPFVVLLARKYPVTRVRQPRVFFLHLAASVLFSLIHITVYLPLFRLMAWPEGAMYLRTLRLALLTGFMTVFPLGVLVYWVILGITTAIELSGRYRQEGVRASRLEMRLAEAQLNALRMQLQPHFLFNTLHSLSDLVLEDANEATRMIARLGDFLRMTLDGSGSQLVPLKREMDFLSSYLEIEQVRFQDRLRVQIEVDPRVESVLVPNLILQPLVENAIRHGIGRRIGPGRIDISARLISGLLEIEIMDDGPGLDEHSQLEKKQGVGLVNVRERVHYIYGDAGRLVLTNGVKGGLAATLSLPISEPEPQKIIGKETLA